MAFLGLAFADIMPKDFVSKMQVVENEAKALMHTEPKRANDDFVSPQNQWFKNELFVFHFSFFPGWS